MAKEIQGDMGRVSTLGSAQADEKWAGILLVNHYNQFFFGTIPIPHPPRTGSTNVLFPTLAHTC